MRALWLILAVPAIVAGLWLIDLAAGTDWAVVVAFPAILAVFAWDMLTLHPRVTPLQRFEERERQRAA